ncbi:MAG: hypothetical protein GY717_14245 [Rhodobacteraceae bacterium]|nr:hypothetical protein [Paracoccaceae bacterium]
MKRILAIILAVLPAPVLALSCVQPTVEQAFNITHSAAEAYVPVLGRFSGVPARMDAGSSMPQDRSYSARFKGIALTQRGVDIAMNVPVWVTETCVASWCGNIPNGTQVLTWLRVHGKSYSLTIGACRGNTFFHPTAGQVGTLRTCLHFGAC